MGPQPRPKPRHSYQEALERIRSWGPLIKNTAIAAELNVGGYATKSGRGRWDESSVRRILKARPARKARRI